MSEKLVTVARFADSIEAEMARQKLADYGIKAVVVGRHTADLFAVIPAVAKIELQTLDGQADRAREILACTEEQEQ